MAFSALSAFGPRTVSAQEFYKGRTVTIFVGFEPGASYDFYGRLLARHIGKHLPGSPTVIVSSMPGAGGLRAANHLFAVAPRDGTAIGIVTLSLWLEEVLGNPAVKYKTEEFNWIGRVSDVVGVIMTWNTSKTKVASDLRTREIPIATTGPGSTTYGYSLLLNAFASTRFKIVSGYQGSAPSMLAMERGEVEAATTDWNLLRTGKADWLREKTVNVLLLHSSKRLAELPDVPAAAEMAETSEGRQILTLYASGQDIVGRSFLAPPGLPAARVAELRAAFDATMIDPDLKSEITTAGADFNPLTGVELQQRLTELGKTPPTLLARMKGVLAAQ
jgi:tripartite-type tricarboxylate transporter receptor subunit TctC